MLKGLADYLGLLDQPGDRKHHDGAVPLVGGIAMAIAFSVSALTLSQSLEAYYGLFAALALLAITGIVDDRFGLSTPIRFLMQILAAIVVSTLGGVCLRDVGDLFGVGIIELQGWSYLFTVFCMVGVINAVNMSDGVDGLAGGLTAISAFCLAILAGLSGRYGLDGALLLLLVAVIAGFLCFNLRHPWRRQASVFMGDAGSMVLGLVLAWFLIDLSQGQQRAFSPVIALWVFALPLLDTVSIMLRRLLRGQNPFQADRQHLHHILLIAGYSDARTTAILLTIAGLFGGVGIISWHLAVPDYILFSAFMILFVVYFCVMNRAWFTIKTRVYGT